MKRWSAATKTDTKTTMRSSFCTLYRPLPSSVFVPRQPYQLVIYPEHVPLSPNARHTVSLKRLPSRLNFPAEPFPAYPSQSTQFAEKSSRRKSDFIPVHQALSRAALPSGIPHPLPPFLTHEQRQQRPQGLSEASGSRRRAVSGIFVVRTPFVRFSFLFTPSRTQIVYYALQVLPRPLPCPLPRLERLESSQAPNTTRTRRLAPNQLPVSAPSATSAIQRRKWGKTNENAPKRTKMHANEWGRRREGRKTGN